MKQSDIDRIGLPREPTTPWLRGFGGGTVYVNQKVTAQLTVDLASDRAEALVVPDNVQNDCRTIIY